jgi:hypothetical protein
MMTWEQAAERLEYLRAELRAERISWGELAELQGLADYIPAGDTELLEAAGVPEFADETAEPATVIFRQWRTRRDGHGVIALFPYDPWDNTGVMCGSFEHTGQHGGADLAGVMARTRPAPPEAYAALQAELEAPPYGYVLRVRRRTPADAAAVRRAALHNRVITPDNSPDRFTEEEAALFRAGRCGWVTGYGLPWTEHCGKRSKPGASFGNCPEHDAELLEEYYPDGTPRHWRP